MNKRIIYIGLILIPFLEIMVRFIPYVFPDVPDTRIFKETFSLYLALGLFLSVLWQGNLKKVSNKWLLVLVGYCLFSFGFWWKMPFVVNNVMATSFWMWKPLFQMIVFFLMTLSVSSIDFRKKDVVQLMNIMSFVGLVMGIYLLLQYFGVDQFYKVKDFKVIGWGITNPNMVGTLGQPTIVAPLIAITALCSVFVRRYIISALLCGVVFLINSQMATGALACGLTVYFLMMKPRGIYVVLVILLVIGYIFIQNPSKIEGNGRFQAWEQVAIDWKGSPLDEDGNNYSYFGVGLGSFGYVFHEKNDTVYYQAHNDPLEVMYGLGMVGLGLYLMAIFNHIWLGFKDFLKFGDWRKRFMAILISIFVLMHLNSLGTFLFQLGYYQYIVALVAGLIINSSIFGGKK